MRSMPCLHSSWLVSISFVVLHVFNMLYDITPNEIPCLFSPLKTRFGNPYWQSRVQPCSSGICQARGRVLIPTAQWGSLSRWHWIWSIRLVYTVTVVAFEILISHICFLNDVSISCTLNLLLFLGLKPDEPGAFSEIATKELQNGRLAMLGAAGIIAQELTNGEEIFVNLGLAADRFDPSSVPIQF